VRKEAHLQEEGMKRIAMIAALALAALPAEAAPDGKYTVKVTVSGMS
jgi:hypothetical protein